MRLRRRSGRAAAVLWRGHAAHRAVRRQWRTRTPAHGALGTARWPAGSVRQHRRHRIQVVAARPGSGGCRQHCRRVLAAASPLFRFDWRDGQLAAARIVAASARCRATRQQAGMRGEADAAIAGLDAMNQGRSRRDAIARLWRVLAKWRAGSAPTWRSARRSGHGAKRTHGPSFSSQQRAERFYRLILEWMAICTR